MQITFPKTDRQTERELDRFHPVNARAQRRASDRAFARQQRKGKKSYMRRAMLEQRVVNDLQHAFDVLDGRIEVDYSNTRRIRAGLLAKQDLLIEQTPGLTATQAADQLRAMAGR